MIKSENVTLQELKQNFVKEIENLGGKSFLIEEKEVDSNLEAILSDTINKLVVYQTPLIDELILKTFLSENKNFSVEWLPANKPSDFNEKDYRQKMIQADAGLVAADYLIADTGTIVLYDENHRAQLVTLLPPTLIVLATTKQLTPDLFSLNTILKNKDIQNFPNLHYITGPSRTSDIEKTLILGVHGPVKLYVLLVEK